MALAYKVEENGRGPSSHVGPMRCRRHGGDGALVLKACRDRGRYLGRHRELNVSENHPVGKLFRGRECNRARARGRSRGHRRCRRCAAGCPSARARARGCRPRGRGCGRARRRIRVLVCGVGHIRGRLCGLGCGGRCRCATLDAHVALPTGLASTLPGRTLNSSEESAINVRALLGSCGPQLALGFGSVLEQGITEAARLAGAPIGTL
mmetsp:Transcript_4541/g.11412  ORF Transcript_4541/g.11412 Transcript_4541/m.11412 type:complete len:208 (-) Transcript_4541:224-847(-)